MPREHFDITMTDDELHAFLGSFNRLILATNDRDGGTWGDGVAYSFMAERIYFRVPEKTRSLANIRSDDRVCCVVESHPKGSSYYAIQAALLHGRAREEGDADVQAALAGVPDPTQERPVRRDDLLDRARRHGQLRVCQDRLPLHGPARTLTGADQGVTSATEG